MYIDFMADSLGMEPLGLKTKDAVNILEIEDGFQVLRLCASSDICGKCAKKLRREVYWERANKRPEPEGWLICSEV